MLVGQHHDKIHDFPLDSSVCTYSVGAARILRLVRLSDGYKQDIELADDSLFILGPRTNQLWKHTIVKTAKSVQPRLSLTYRAISSRYSPVTRHITMGLPSPSLYSRVRGARKRSRASRVSVTQLTS